MAGFEFVNITNPKEAKQHSTRVRRHVMKDIGQARRKPKPAGKEKLEAKVTDEMATGKEKRREVAVSVGRERDMSSVAARAAGSPRIEGWISHMVYPVEMNEDKLSLVRFLVEEARDASRPFRFTWLAMGLMDEAAWYMTLANAAVWRGDKHGDPSSKLHGNVDAMRYYAKSLDSIGRRLQDFTDDDADGLIVAVAGCLFHDSSVGYFDRMNIHLSGLKRIVDKRGGINQLKSPLLKLALLWLDLNTASFLNSGPHFDPPKGSFMEVDDVGGDDTKYLHTLLQRWDAFCPFLGDILNAITATANVATYINRRAHDPDIWKDDITMARLTGPALHEILTLQGRPLPDDPLDPQYSAVAAREAFRRAALIFIGEVKTRCQVGARELPRHLDAFRQISRLPLVDWAVVPELNMWAHIVAGVQEEDSEDRRWHVAVIAGIMGIMDLRTGAEALDVARGVIWVESIMGEKAKKLEMDIDAHLCAESLSLQLQGMPLDPALQDLDSVLGDLIAP